MARYTGSVCRICRREGQKLFLKGDRCYTAKCAYDRRPVAPGQHGQSRKKLSNYGIQLREKQKTRKAYGLLESQFKKYYEMAVNMKGVTGENLLQLLERRLDNAAFRLGFGLSRAQARQMVCHGHIQVNGKRVDIPSYLVNVGDIITIQERSRKIAHIVELRENGKTTPEWLELNAETLTGRVAALPARDQIDLTIHEQLVVELYSR
jgi:small subunit ribosomal protein S4